MKKELVTVVEQWPRDLIKKTYGKMSIAQAKNRIFELARQWASLQGFDWTSSFTYNDSAIYWQGQFGTKKELVARRGDESINVCDTTFTFLSDDELNKSKMI